MIQRILDRAFWFASGVWAWIALKPGTRPRRVTRQIIQKMVRFLFARPKLAGLARRFYNILPQSVQARLHAIISRQYLEYAPYETAGATGLKYSQTQAFARSGKEMEFSRLPQHARRIYHSLNAAIDENERLKP